VRDFLRGDVPDWMVAVAVIVVMALWFVTYGTRNWF
jgi:hypothetical protein